MGLFSKRSGDTSKDWEQEYHKEQARIAKLWDAYEEQAEIISGLERKERAMTEALRLLDAHLQGRSTKLTSVLRKGEMSEEDVAAVEEVLNG